MLLLNSLSCLHRYVESMGLQSTEDYGMDELVAGLSNTVGTKLTPTIAQYSALVMGLIQNDGTCCIPTDIRVYALITVARRISVLPVEARAAIEKFMSAKINTGGVHAIITRQRLGKVWDLLWPIEREGMVAVASFRKALLKRVRIKESKAKSQMIKDRVQLVCKFIGTVTTEKRIPLIDLVAFTYIFEDCVTGH